ncbi:CaiB/BaiF CoA-transferase family protein [Phytohabitans sp. ZYX-F-186]|uniref:CaiB/BaiF CoA-transferase family protein n=1 Tax=Phytohabitans maris TaxID=3071409 RepID=A0ABU0ZBZ5_9ACTN|nr:CaiB/BaiF CoA-transferase family protein [Phytohabitans sp. ZYX-F-186]MDQ7903876.1 CaiB/BaiF CoA-transferase family protein [Phytohabitans sp. ZYX-F-186]
MGGALEGLLVVDLSRILAGPYCTQMLGDHGAEVVKVEPPEGDGTREWAESYGDGVSAYYAGLNRNKRHVTVDLSTAAGRTLVLRMLENADVLVENFKTGTMERWGIGAETLLARFPRLVYCRISAFGADGPMGGLPGYDAVIQAYSGIMHMNGEPGSRPLRIPMPITDLTTGMLAFSGVLLALQERTRSGRGQLVDLSLLDGALSLLHPAAANYFRTGERPERLGSAHPNIAPCDTFTSPMGEIYVAAGTDRQFAILCEYLGAPEVARDERFRTNAARLAHRAELTAILADLVARMEYDADAARTMIAKGIPASLVRPLDEVLGDPEVHRRRMVQTVDGRRVLGIPVKLGRTPGTIRTPPRPAGADTRDVLARFGLAAREIERLIADGVVTQHRPSRG